MDDERPPVREAYVDAVARRSGTSQRANVQAYLDGETLVM